MSYCVICGRQHDPGVGCLDGAGQALRDIGLPQGRPELPPGRKPSSAARKWTLFWVGLLLAVIVAFLIYRLASAFGAR
jgi:hypothetical protein